MAAPATTPAAAADRLAAARARLGDPASARKSYRLRVVSTREKPAPFEAVVVAGHSFSERTHRHVEDDRGRWVQENRRGTIENLTDAEVAKIKARIPDYIVRWRNRDALLASVIDAAIPTVVLDPNTDEPLEPYVVIEEVKQQP